MTPGPGIFRTKLPEGFYAAGVNSGVRRYRPDLGIILSKQPCVAAGVFTQSSCQAAPVKYCQKILPASNIKAVVTNSGQANAATGEQGNIDNQSLVESVARELGCNSKQVLIASTGVIGEPMEVDKLTAAVPSLVASVSTIAEKFATAILTTDLVPKTVMKPVVLSQGTVMITGICKGSGMIHPNMATMLGYILTDATLTEEQAQHCLSISTDESFNMISVDGETSTNDSVFILANGASGIPLTTRQDEENFQQAVQEVMIELAKSIARDGEGATKLLEVKLKHATSAVQAKDVARSLTVSPLIKSAINGASPNWGRIIARLGQEGVGHEALAHCLIYFQGCLVYGDGNPIKVDAQQLIEKMKQDTVTVVVDLQLGDAEATAWGCDLSQKYVKINAEYLT